MSSDETVLVIGATGRHGGVGAGVALGLLRRGVAVRALVRGDDERAERLREHGVEVVVGDLHDRRTLAPAIDGVEQVFFTYPVASGVIGATANFVSVLRELEATPQVLAMSMGASLKESPSGLGRASWVAEELLFWGGVDATVLRIAGFFYENILALHGEEIRESGVIANSFGSGAVPWIAAEDVADLCVVALVKPDVRAEGPVQYTPATTALSHQEIAAIISRETGRAVRHERITPEHWRKELDARPGPLVNPAMAHHISTLGGMFAQLERSPLVTPDPEKFIALVGRAPITFAEFVLSHSAEFGADAAV